MEELFRQLEQRALLPSSGAEFPDEAADLVGAAAVPRTQASCQSPNQRAFGWVPFFNAPR